MMYIEQLDYVADTAREMKDHIHTTTTATAGASTESAITTDLAATIDYSNHDVNIIDNNSSNEYIDVINSESDVHIPHNGHLDG